MQEVVMYEETLKGTTYQVRAHPRGRITLTQTDSAGKESRLYWFNVSPSAFLTSKEHRASHWLSLFNRYCINQVDPDDERKAFGVELTLIQLFKDQRVPSVVLRFNEQGVEANMMTRFVTALKTHHPCTSIKTRSYMSHYFVKPRRIGEIYTLTELEVIFEWIFTELIRVDATIKRVSTRTCLELLEFQVEDILAALIPSQELAPASKPFLLRGRPLPQRQLEETKQWLSQQPDWVRMVCYNLVSGVPVLVIPTNIVRELYDQ